MNWQFGGILNYHFWGNTLQQYLIALGVFAFSWIILKAFELVGIKKFKALARRTKTDFDDLIVRAFGSLSWPFYLFLSFYVASQFVKISQGGRRAVLYAVLIVLTFYAVKILQDIIDFAFKKLIARRQEEERRFDPSAIQLLSKVSKAILWAAAAMIILQNLGYNISTLIAGLGVGGIAVAFALQNILSDIFASFSIYFDKPFQTGDFIVIGEEKGTVKKIGIKSTRIQTLQGDELVVSNKKLTESNVHNYKRMRQRRINFSFGVEYETPTRKIKKIPAIVRDIFAGIELANLERVHFKELGDFSLNFEVVYYLKSSDYVDYMNTQQEINIALMECFEKEGISFAYPTQTIFLNKQGKPK